MNQSRSSLANISDTVIIDAWSSIGCTIDDVCNYNFKAGPGFVPLQGEKDFCRISSIYLK